MSLFKLLMGAAIALLLFFIVEMKQLVVRCYSLSFETLPESFQGCRMVHLSDLHGNVFGKKQKRLCKAIDEQHPDCIIITGDMVTDCDDASVERVIEFLEGLAKKYPIYYAPGNHETRALEHGEEGINAYKKYVQRIKNAGIIYLENEKADWMRDGASVVLYGLSLEREYFGKLWNYKVPQPEHVEHLLGRADKESFSVLLAHHPDYFAIYEKWGGDLVFSGHIHGGIAKLPWIGGVLSPTMRLFPQYDGGVYEGKNGTCRMVLSRGLGSHTIPLRPFNPPELVVVTLQKQDCKKQENHV